MKAVAASDIWTFSHWRLPVATLVVVTLALNVLGLTIPIAATQVFDRILSHPGSPTLIVIAVGVAFFGMIEALLRLGRSYMLHQAGATYAWMMTHQVLKRVVTSDVDAGPLRSSGSLEYLGAVQQTKEKYNGQVLVGIVELFFLPVILGLITYISPVAGGIIFLCLIVFGVVTTRQSLALREIINANTQASEDRYNFLFVMLSSMHSIKAMAIEDNILRRYENLQARLAKGNHQAAKIVGRLLNGAPIANQVIVAAMLTYGAFAVINGGATLGSVSALVLLGGRVMAPLQRAVFILVQLRDVGNAQEKITEILTRKVSGLATEGLQVANEGSVAVDDLSYVHPETGDKILDQVNLTLLPGEIFTLSGTSESACSCFLQLLAGIRAPSEGSIRLNGHDPLSYPQTLLNRCVGYVPSNGVMFRGTIRDNITRFGEVTVDDAMEVARLLELDGTLNQLPRGLDTDLLGGLAETIPPGVRQQVAILRALVTRPKLILLDNADRGLDRESYSRLHRFLGRIDGQVSMIIVSDDANLVGRASRHFMLDKGKLDRVSGAGQQSRTAYKDLKL